MAGKDDQPERAGALRRLAEQIARGNAALSPESLKAISLEEIRLLLHELQVHQIELEMQNEELRRAQTELDAARARYFDLYDLAPVGYVTVSEQGLILEANLAAATLLGEARGALVKKPIHRFILKEDQDIYYLQRKRLFEVETPQECELRMVKGDGTPFWAHLAFTDAKSKDDSSEIRIVLSDVSERKRAEAALRELGEQKARVEDQMRQAQKMEAIGQLAGGVAHDFNNITAIVLGYGEMLLNRLGPEDPSRKCVEQIVAAGRRSATLTRQLLAFGRRQTLLPEVLDLNALLRNLDIMLSRLIGEDIQLEFKLAEELSHVTADAGQLEQVVTNLVINARDAMPKGGRLTVETADVELDLRFQQSHEGAVPGKYVLLAFTDTGCGMEKAVLARLFEPFFTTKEKGKGTGLGLSTAFGIVKQSGGYIYASSEPGVGTSFKIYLPRTEAQPRAKAAESAGEMPRGDGELILLVEDEAPLRELCKTILSELGYRVSAAASGPEALRLVLEQETFPDLVLTDVIMPGMSGTAMVERLQRNRPSLKVLYISGYPDDTIAPHGALAPNTSFLQKPFGPQALAAKIREMLAGKPAAVQSARRVLMIDDDEQFRELVRHFCTKRGHVFAGADSAAAALAALATQTFDVFLVDLNIPGTSGEQVLREINGAGYAAPAIVLTGDVATADMNVLRPLGVVSVVAKSSTAQPLLQAIEAAGAEK